MYFVIKMVANYLKFYFFSENAGLIT